MMQDMQYKPHHEGVQGMQSGASTRELHTRKEHLFLKSLVRELFQTEQSAKAHPLLEAERLGDVPPAHAMRAVAEHAAAVMAELPSLMERNSLPVSGGAMVVGEAFSALRDHLADFLLNSERSYRGTLLGMRHGLDLVELLRRVATAEGNPMLAMWCTGWIETRTPLVEAVARELVWFAAHPERATQAAKSGPVVDVVHVLLNGFEHVAGKLLHLFPKNGSRVHSHRAA